MRKDQAAELLLSGKSPTATAKEMSTTPANVMQYLCLKIGEGELRRSDIAFSLPQELRTAIEEIIDQTESASAAVIRRELRKRGLHQTGWTSASTCTTGEPA